MRSKLSTILKLALTFMVAMGYQSCDSTLNIDKPTSFYKYIGKDGDQNGIDLVTDPDGNIYILGSTGQKDQKQVYVVMTSPDGNVLWEQEYGDGSGDHQVPKDIERLRNGDLVVVADRTDLASGEQDIAIYVINHSDGTLAQPRALNGLPNIKDYANAVTQILDGFVVAAYRDNGLYKTGAFLRFSEDLQEQTVLGTGWTSDVSQQLGTSGYDFVPVKIFQVRQDLFYSFGYTNSTIDGRDLNSDYNVFVLVSNEDNSLLHIYIPPGPEETSNERITSVRAVPTDWGGGYVLSGYMSGAGSTQEDLYMVRTIQDLNQGEPAIIPSDPKTYLYNDPKVLTAGLASLSTTPASVYASQSSGFLILGEENAQGNRNIFLTKVDNSFNLAWTEPNASHIFGGVGNDSAGAVAEAADGGILVCGSMILGDQTGQSKIVLMKLTPEGMLGN